MNFVSLGNQLLESEVGGFLALLGSELVEEVMETEGLREDG